MSWGPASISKNKTKKFYAVTITDSDRGPPGFPGLFPTLKPPPHSKGQDLLGVHEGAVLGCIARKKGWNESREKAWQPWKGWGVQQAALQNYLQMPGSPSESPDEILLGQDSGFGEFWWDRRTES